jgi:Zn/Cd-binding protein ZinT
LLGIFASIACEKDENKTIILENPQAATIGTMPSFDDFNLDNADNELIFSWTSADFGFSSSTTYILEIDSASKNFSNPIEILSTQELTCTITIGDFNQALLDAGYDEYDISHSMQMRVVATISSNVDSVYSTPSDFNVAIYATVFPPIYMCGAATGGWDWNSDVEMRSITPKVYQTIAHFINNETFRFFAQRDWSPTSYNYPYFTSGTIDSKLEDAGDGDNNFRFIGTTGYYDITCDMKTLTITMTAVDEPVMYMTGGALGGWDWTTNYVQMTWISNGIFEATTEFINGETFRFFAQADWSPTSYNYPYFADGEVDPLFEDALDGDNNFRFIGTTGNYTITLNLLDNIVTMEAAK